MSYTCQLKLQRSLSSKASLVRVQGGQDSEAEIRIAKRIQRNRIASLKQLLGFLCVNRKFSKLHRRRTMMLLTRIPISYLNARIQRAHLIILVWFLIFFPFPLLLGSIGMKEHASLFG